ncbi:TBC1 domain family member 10A-like [Scomber scombrus]|uniref:TBC1 domain family member 10A-like n=1 Tax=Scomber scombrus TaxID=13677 RepID=A0AAV1NPH1_SCOSC
MAELYTLSPSPPALGDPHAAPSIPPSSSGLPAPSSPAPESTREIPLPKSSLYNDKALTGNPSGGSTSPLPPPVSPKPAARPLLPLLVHEAAPQIKESAGIDAETVAQVIKQETVTNDPPAAAAAAAAAPDLLIANTETPALLNEPPALLNETPVLLNETPALLNEPPALLNETPALSEVPQTASPSPELNPGPNLYPNVHVTHNPNPVMEYSQFMVSQPQPAACYAPVPPVSPYTAAASPYTAAASPYTAAAPPYTAAASPYTAAAPPYTEAASPYTAAASPYTAAASPYTEAASPYTAAASPYTEAASPDTASAAAAEEEEPQPSQEAQNPQSQPLAPPVSPKPETPKTPTRAEHSSPSVPTIHEPVFVLPNPNRRPAPDTLSYLESASLMSGTLESLSGLGEDGSSIGSDSEVNGLSVRRTDKYGFLGGNQYSEGSDKEVRVEVARQREMKWLDMFNNWDKWVKHRFQKVKLRCRKGIPSSLRSKAWQLLSNSQELLDNNIGKFEELEREPGEAKWLDIIEKDLHRQFPFHEMFAARGGHGQQDLFRILKAYTVYRPDEGYCQAQAPVAAVLLMHMPAEQAFWCLVQICEKYLPGYYSAGLEAIQLDGEIFFSLLRRTCPMAYRHLKKFKIDPILYMTEWFMCIFSRTLPWSSVLRVWDMFFCEGVKIVFRVGLVLLKQMLGSVDKLRELQGMYETMERLRNISPESVREEILVQEIIILPVTESLIERECNIQVRKWRESRGALTHEPVRRLHGTRAIFEFKRRASAISSGGSFSFLGSSIPPPGPLRASSSLLSLPGFRKNKTPFHTKKGSFSGPSGRESPTVHLKASPVHAAALKPPIPPGAGQKAAAPHVQSPLVGSAAGSSQGASAPPTQNTTPPKTLSPSPRNTSEQVTPSIPSPTANNSPLPPCSDPKKDAEAASASASEAASGEEDGKKKKRSKEDKKKEKEDEKKKLKEKKEKEKAEKERLKKEKERLEKEKKKGGKKKDKGGGSGGGGGGEVEDKNGAAAAAAARDSA